MVRKTTNLNKRQTAAFNQLERAFAACCRENVLVWDNYGIISAVNGNHVLEVAPDPSLDEPYDDGGYEFSPGCWHGSNVDDPLYIAWKRTK